MNLLKIFKGMPDSAQAIQKNFETIQELENKEGYVLYNGNSPLGASITYNFPAGMTLESLKEGIYFIFDTVDTSGNLTGKSIPVFWPSILGTTTLATFPLIDNGNTLAVKFARINSTNIQGHADNDTGNRVNSRLRKVILV